MIKVGPAGSGGVGNLKGIQKIARMKLDCMEVEFTYGVRMSMDAAREVGGAGKGKEHHLIGSCALLHQSGIR